jgi:hypothetical protein
MRTYKEIFNHMQGALTRYQDLKDIGEFERNIVQTEVMHKMESYATALKWVLKENE